MIYGILLVAVCNQRDQIRGWSEGWLAGDTAPVKLSSVSLEKKIDTTEEMICPLIRPQLFTLSLHKISYYEEKRKIVQPEGILCFYPVPEVVCVACLESLHHRNSWIS